MNKGFLVAIDLGGTNLKIALLDAGCRIKDRRVLETESFSRKEELISAIVKSVNKIIEGNSLSKGSVIGIGVGLPGPVDVEKGLVRFLPNIPGWKQVRLRAVLHSRIKLPVFIDNDANLAALAEHRLGAARGAKNAICITLGTGVGGGLILDGRLYRGSNFAAGEFGHMPINEYGPRCNCGGAACLEVYIGNKKIERQAEAVFGRRITLEELSSFANKNNRKAVKLWGSVGTRLGIALAGVVNLLNPDIIVVGGGVAGAGKVLFDKVKETIKSRAMHVQSGHVSVVKAKLGSDAGLYGAAILAKEGIVS